MPQQHPIDSLYIMQRANGDWFAFDDRGRLCVPVFRSSRDGMLARARDWGMHLFKPVALDERALKHFTQPVGDVDFWVVDNPFTNVGRGRSVDHEQLTRLVMGRIDQPTAP